MNLPTYLLDGGQAGRERLRLLSRTMEPLSAPFLSSLDIQPGMSCLDVGCGGGDVTRLLARMCGPDGHVTGLDADADVLAIAQAESHADDASAAIGWVCADVNSFATDERFDVVYARFLLTHVTDAMGVLRNLSALVRPGGIVAIEDVWFPGHFCWPPSAAFDQCVRWYCATARKRGGNPEIGIQLPEMFETLGLRDIAFGMRTQAWRTGDEKSLTLITLDRMRQAVLDAGIADEASFNALRDELRAYTFDTSTTLSMSPVMQIRGRLSTSLLD